MHIKLYNSQALSELKLTIDCLEMLIHEKMMMELRSCIIVLSD